MPMKLLNHAKELVEKRSLYVYAVYAYYTDWNGHAGVPHSSTSCVELFIWTFL